MRRSLILALTLIFAVVTLTTGAGLAEAATSRVAIITKIEGTVEVQKSGGKKTLKGFKNMSLNEGDIVTTGSKSSVELKFSNGTSTDDTLVLESSSTVTFSKLSTKNGTTTKVKMKNGKAWVDVKSIATKDDDFQLETPTAIMGVRGTNFFVGIDPNSGQSVIGLLSGIIQLQSKDDRAQQPPQQIYPAQIFFHNPDSGNMIGNMSNQSLEQLLQLTSPAVMQSIINNLAKIQRENEEQLQRLLQAQGSDSQLPASDEVLLNNIRNVASAILLAALNRNLISQVEMEALQEEIKKVMQPVNDQISSQLDGKLNNRVPNNQYDFELQKKNEQMQEQLDRTMKTKEDLIEELKRKQEELIEELKRKQEEQRLKNEQEKQRRADEAMQKLLENMSEAEKARFNADNQRRLEEERNQQRSTPAPVPPRPTLTPSTPTPTPTATATPTPTPTATATPTPTPTATTTPTPTPTATTTPTATPTPSWEDVASPFTVEYVLYSSIEPLSYTAEEGVALSYRLDEAVASTGDDQLVFTPNVADAEIIAVTINGEELEEVNGSFIWNLPAMPTDFAATVMMDHVSYGLGELTLRGVISYEPPPSWEDELAPFLVEYVRDGQSLTLDYSADEQEVLSYILDENLVSQGNDQLVLTPNVADAEITAVSINGEDVQKVNGSYIWNLPKASSDLFATITVFHPSYSYAELTLRGIVSYEPQPSWEDEAVPVTLEHMFHGYKKTLSYSVSQQEALSFMLGEALVTQGLDQLVITPNVADASILSVTINGQSLQGEVDRYIWPLPEESTLLAIEINMSHPIYGNDTLTINGEISYEPPQGWADVAYPLILDYEVGEEEYAQVIYTATYEQGAFHIQIPDPISVEDFSMLRIYTPGEEYQIISANINGEQHAIEDNLVLRGLGQFEMLVANISMNHSVFGPVNISMVIETAPDQTDNPVSLSFGGPGMAFEEYQPIYYYIEGYGEEYEGIISFGVDSPYQQPYLRIMPNKYSIVSLIYEVDGSPIEIAPGNAENGLLLQEIVVVNEYTNYLLTVQDNDTLEQKVYKIDGYFYTGI